MEKSNFERGAGVLCHISSLPNKYGIGSLGKEAYDFLAFLKKSKIKYWQILPLVQTGYGDSPYQSVCCNSGNPYFIDLDSLKDSGLLTPAELEEARMPSGNIDYGALYERRYATLRKAYERFDVSDKKFKEFIDSGEYEDYALFMSLKSVYGVSLKDFPSEYKFRNAEALEKFKADEYKTQYCFWQFVQYMFRCQWQRLKEAANSLGIKIIGDIPLYVAYDSSDVWGRPEMFLLDENLNPTEVAGVPPDYFSSTGQLWGNPLYDWDAAEKEGYKWWVQRIKRALDLYDIVRIDHFRGFDRFYAIPAAAQTAEIGEWRAGPSLKLFERAETELGKLSVIAEDLGIIDEGVVALREGTGFPGMKIMMFAFDGNPDNDYLPRNISENSVTYTGTHDNDTVLGYINSMDEESFAKFKKQLRVALRYEKLRCPLVTREDAAKALVKCAYHSRSDICVVPVQDVLLLDNAARMNLPASASGNWQFRLEAQPSQKTALWLGSVVVSSGRQ